MRAQAGVETHRVITETVIAGQTKGVICHVEEDENMPVDEFGVRADVICGSASETISRMNPSRVFESYFGAFARDNRTRIINRLTEKYGKNYINKMKNQDYLDVWEYLKALYTYVSPKMVEFSESLTNIDDIIEHVNEVLEDWLYLYFPPNNLYRPLDCIREIEKSEFKPNYGKVSYVNGLGQRVTTKRNVRIGRMYLLLLDRTGRDFSAVSSAKVNSHMLPVKVSDHEKYRYPHSLTPVTNMSETETRFITAFGKAFIAEIYDLALNPTSHKNLVKSILEGETMFDHNYEINRRINPYGGSAPLGMFKHLLTAYGITMRYVDTDVTNEVSNNEV